jgi:LacI family transcriptional regulator, galactose operon repressor
MTQHRANQKEIARRCGVSQSTVSLALGKKGARKRLADHTLERILREADRLRYRPHAAARGLRTGRSHCLVFAPAAFPTGLGHVAMSVLGAIFSAAAGRGYAFEIAPHEPQGGGPSALETAIAARRCDGVFISDDPAQYRRCVELLGRHQLPVCSVEAPPTAGLTTVSFNYRAGARAVVEHLIATGRRRIAFIVAARELPYYARERYEGYREALQAAGLGLDRDLHCVKASRGNGERSDLPAVRRSVAKLLASGVELDAIFAEHDLVALACLLELADRGVAVLDDVAVVGFDDVPLSEGTVPPLTTVRQNPEALGRMAVDLLVDEIEGRREAGGHHVAPTELVIRQSSVGRSKSEVRRTKGELS